MKHLLRHTIWATGSIPFEEWKYRNLKRVYLPLYDALFVWAGLAAVRYGIPSIDYLVPELVGDVLSYTLVSVALLCLVGVAIPRWWRLEVAAKTGLLALLIMYFLALRVMGAEAGSSGREFISIIVLAATVLILFRFNLLSEEARQRRRQQAEG